MVYLLIFMAIDALFLARTCPFPVPSCTQAYMFLSMTFAMFRMKIFDIHDLSGHGNTDAYSVSRVIARAVASRHCVTATADRNS